MDLATLLPKKPDRETLETLLEAALTGRSLDEDAGDDFSDVDTSTIKRQSSKANEQPPASTVTSGDDDDDAEAAALVASLKAKRQAAAQ